MLNGSRERAESEHTPGGVSRFPIAPGTYIIDTSAPQASDRTPDYPFPANVPPEIDDWPKRQADYSYQLVRDAFETGALRIVRDEEDPSGPTTS